MATLQSLNLDTASFDANERPIYRRLALLNGLLIGLALATGAWGVEAIRVAQLPFQYYLSTLVLGIALITLLGALTGWVTGRLAKTIITVPLWLITTALSLLTMGYLGYYGRTLVVWLADRRFWGRDIYPYTADVTVSGLILGGFLLFVIVGTLALLQSYRLENLVNNLGGKNRLDGRTWLGLLWPLIFVFLAAYFTKNSMSDPAATAATAVNDAIQVAQTYEGDLAQLALTTGINYGALGGVRDRLQGDYTLNIAEVDPRNATVMVTLNFENGAWLYCRLINGQLSHCYDASPLYTTGLRSALTGELVPEDCLDCEARFENEALRDQIQALGQGMGDSVSIERVAQLGSHVLMRAIGADNRALDCWYEGVIRTYLTGCTEVTTEP